MQKLAIGTIRFYQNTISPVIRGLVACRFTPTCSEYAIEAIKRFGVLKGSGLAIYRIVRCNPFGGSGYDPVPQPKMKRNRQ